MWVTWTDMLTVSAYVNMQLCCLLFYQPGKRNNIALSRKIKTCVNTNLSMLFSPSLAPVCASQCLAIFIQHIAQHTLALLKKCAKQLNALIAECARWNGSALHSAKAAKIGFFRGKNTIFFRKNAIFPQTNFAKRFP